jgi:ferredoxin
MAGIHCIDHDQRRSGRVRLQPGEVLLDVLRNRAGLIGAKEGCGTGDCGACSVTLDGASGVRLPGARRRGQGSAITTVEGLAAATCIRCSRSSSSTRRCSAASARRASWWRPRCCSIATRIRPSRRSATRSPAISAAAPATTRSSAPCRRRRRSWMRSKNATKKPQERNPKSIQETTWHTTRFHQQNSSSSARGRRGPDGVDKVTGRARYGADAFAPGQLVGMILRSPHAHAEISKIDTSKAEKLPGVKAVITSADLPDLTGRCDLLDILENCMARGRALYDGHAVAAVAAIDARRQSRRSSSSGRLPVCRTSPTSTKPCAPTRPSCSRGCAPPAAIRSRSRPTSRRSEFGHGDVEAGFAEADVIIERSYKTEQTHQGYIEPHACLASVGPDGRASCG